MGKYGPWLVLGTISLVSFGAVVYVHFDQKRVREVCTPIWYMIAVQEVAFLAYAHSNQ